MSNNYLQLPVLDICEDIEQKIYDKRVVQIKGVDLIIHPHVYPSHLFRTPVVVIEALQDRMKNATVCDMGCGPGTIGLFAHLSGASKVVQADINPYAVRNAEENREYHEISSNQMKVYESDCFDNIPEEKFDLIVFNAPFHPDNIIIENPLQNAFFDPCFKTLRKFLSALRQFADSKTEIYIAYTNRINTDEIELIFEEFSLSWELWKVKNAETKFDNRIYKLTLQ